MSDQKISELTSGTPASTDILPYVDLNTNTTKKTLASAFAPALGTDDNYVTDAEKIVIGNTSGTNSGDNATNSQYSGLATLIAGKENLHGVEAYGAITFDNSSHILSIASGTNTYWYQGVKYTTASAITCDLDSYITLTTNTLYYVYFDDASGTLKASTSFWNLKTTVPVATVYWNGSAGAVNREAHNHTRDLDWHTNAHLTIGARYYSGLILTLPTTATDGSLEIEAGTIYDEDIRFDISEQTVMRGWYKTGASVYTWADYALPYLGTAGAPEFLDTDTYTLATFATGDFACYWVYATTDIDRPIQIVPTHRNAAWGTLGTARTETAPDLVNLGMNPEWKLIYRFIYAGNGQFQESADYRQSSSLPSGGSTSISAAAVSYTPGGSIASTNVQNAIEELDTEKAPLASPTFTGTVILPKAIEIQDTSADHQYVLAVNELTADRTITLPLLTGTDTFAFEAHTQTLTNKRINPRVVTAASYTTDTGTSLDVSTCDQFQVTAQAGALKFNNPGGTPVAGQKLIIRVKDNGTARALTYDTQFRAMGNAFPSTTVVNKTLYLGLIFNATDTKWDLVAVAQEA